MGKFAKILGIVLQAASIAEAVHGAGSGAEKKAMVVGIAKQLAPIALQKAGHDPADADELVDHAVGAFEQTLAVVKGLKK